MSDFLSLTYKELQQQAKALGIPANKKKEALIEALTALSKTTKPDDFRSDPVETLCEETSRIELDQQCPTSPSHSDSSGPSEIKEICQTSIATEDVEDPISESLTIVTCETAAIGENIATNLPVEHDSTEYGNECSEDDFDSSDVLSSSESPLIPVSDYASHEKVSTPTKPHCDSEMNDHTETPVDDAYEEREYEEDINCVGDIDAGGKLRGLPTPLGVRTLIASPEPNMAQSVHWRYEDYESPQRQVLGEVVDTEKAGSASDPSVKKLSGLPTPKGQHKYFASPEAVTGSRVHWNYEDFAKDAKDGVEADPVTPTAADKENSCVAAPQTTEKPVMSKQAQLDFWLSKAPKTPIR